ncbi:uncharacterized protein LOC101207928 [Cucumis sativus]|uniref:Uncharacterized protein n=1 Tax=Cucumis sativus TaxID=3659 RepID=A0A0A0L881_CUCSA|nr:uncharacterized protein LOC101207928 [Cucumis sativus]KGN57224.1 hypothetical protein Csa_011616 [Cucumis sativus]
MAKFNVVQKQRRAAKAQIKRDAHGDPLTKKLKIKQQPTYVSNKRKRKLMKKKRREEKEALQMGLTNMEDVEMAVAEELKNTNRTSTKFHVKKSVRLRQLRSKGKKNKGKSSSSSGSKASGDAMVE